MSLKFMTKPSYMDEDETTQTTSVEVEVEVAEKVADELEVEGEASEIIQDADESDAGADQAVVVEAVEEAVATEGLTPGLAKVCEALGLFKVMEAKGIETFGMESLNAGSRNEAQAQLVLAGCEEAKRSWLEAIKAFFKSMLEKIKKIIAFVTQKFMGIERSIGKRIKDINDVKEWNNDVEKEYSGYSEQTLKALKTVVSNLTADISKMSNDSATMKKGADAVKEQYKSNFTMEPSFESVKSKVKASDRQTVLNMMSGALTALSEAKGLAKADQAIKAAAAVAEAAAKSAEKGGNDATEKRKEVEGARALAALVSRDAGMVLKCASAVARAALSAGNALYLCKA